MTKYKCPVVKCKYVSSKPGDCCGKALVKISGSAAKKLMAKNEKGCSCC